MPKNMQNLVVFTEPSENAFETPLKLKMHLKLLLKAGNMILNRFCIDEDAAFELSGVNSLKKASADLINSIDREDGYSPKLILKRIQKGREYSF